MTAAICLLAAAPAQGAAVKRELCRDSAALRDSPAGFVIGHLYRPQTVRLLRRASGNRWGHVKTRTGLRGWLPLSSLCLPRSGG